MRTRSFDAAKVLTGAMHTFRRAGYRGASIKQLERSTGLTSGSLYNAYGDKDGLYRAAFAYYVNGFVRERLEAHAGPQATLDDLEQLFLSLFRPPLTDGHGCMLTNAVVEFGTERSIASDGIHEGLELLTSRIHALLAREIAADQVDVATAHLLLLYEGLLVFTRLGRQDAAFADVVRSEFNRLRKMREV